MSKSTQSTLSQFAKEQLPYKSETLIDDKQSVIINKKTKMGVSSTSYRIERSECILEQSERIVVPIEIETDSAIDLKHNLIIRLGEKNIFSVSQCNCVCHLRSVALDQLQIHKCYGSSCDLPEENVLELLNEAGKTEFPDGVNSHQEEDKPPKLCTEATKQVENQCNGANKGVYILETVIVGRKFNQHTKIEENMLIRAIREPKNPKDQNAIKV